MDSDFSSAIALFAVLLVVAVALMVSHVRSWRHYVRDEANAQDFDYRRRQYRRRMQTSAMLAILAVVMAPGYMLTVWLRSAWFAMLFWIAVMLLACWVVLLALVDMWATRHHYGRLHYDCVLEQAKLQAQLRRTAGGDASSERRP